MGRNENTYTCSNVFRSVSEEERKKRILDLWIQMIHSIEKNQSVHPVKK